jgi:hypothetical protein
MTLDPPRPKVGLVSWKTQELKEHLASTVDRYAEHGSCSVLDVVLELIGLEMETFLLFGRLGHLDPPRLDGKILWAILNRSSKDPIVNEKLSVAVREWLLPVGTDEDPSCWYAGEPGELFRFLVHPGSTKGEVALKVMGDPLVVTVEDARILARRLLQAAEDVEAGRLNPWTVAE